MQRGEHNGRALALRHILSYQYTPLGLQGRTFGHRAGVRAGDRRRRSFSRDRPLLLLHLRGETSRSKGSDAPQAIYARAEGSSQKRQDGELEKLGQGVQRVKALAGVMKEELQEQAVILEDLESDVDRTDSMMQNMSKKMKQLANDAKNSDRALWSIIACLLVLLGIACDHGFELRSAARLKELESNRRLPVHVKVRFHCLFSRELQPISSMGRRTVGCGAATPATPATPHATAEAAPLVDWSAWQPRAAYWHLAYTLEVLVVKPGCARALQSVARDAATGCVHGVRVPGAWRVRVAG